MVKFQIQEQILQIRFIDQMGNTNSADALSSGLQRQSEFEHWKKMGNEVAVSALSNSDKLSWYQLEQKLKTALEYYDKTPSFEYLYVSYGSNPQQINYNSKAQQEKIIKLMQSQSYYGFNYPEEILRVSKNKAVCLRALIQNIYIQMQTSQEKQAQNYNDDLEITSQQIMRLIDNQNLSLRYISEQLGINQSTGKINMAAESAPVKPNSSNNRDGSMTGSVNGQFGPGPGGSPNTGQPPSFTQQRNRSDISNKSPLNTQKTVNLQSGEDELDKSIQSHEKRYVEILLQGEFLFEDKFLKNLLQLESDLVKKIYFLERIAMRLSPFNFDFMRKISWVISKSYFKKSLFSQSTENLQAAIRETQTAIEYLERYIKYGGKIKNNRILVECHFLENCQFLTAKQVQDYKIRLNNHMQMLLYQAENGSRPIQSVNLQSPQKQKMITDMKQMADNIDFTPPQQAKQNDMNADLLRAMSPVAQDSPQHKFQPINQQNQGQHEKNFNDIWLGNLPDTLQDQQTQSSRDKRQVFTPIGFGPHASPRQTNQSALIKPQPPPNNIKRPLSGQRGPSSNYKQAPNNSIQRNSQHLSGTKNQQVRNKEINITKIEVKRNNALDFGNHLLAEGEQEAAQYDNWKYASINQSGLGGFGSPSTNRSRRTNSRNGDSKVANAERQRLEQILKQVPKSYQQKMIQQRIRARLNQSEDEKILRGLCESEVSRLSKLRENSTQSAMASELSLKKERSLSALQNRIDSPKQLGKEEKRAANFQQRAEREVKIISKWTRKDSKSPLSATRRKSPMVKTEMKFNTPNAPEYQRKTQKLEKYPKLSDEQPVYKPRFKAKGALGGIPKVKAKVPAKSPLGRTKEPVLMSPRRPVGELTRNLLAGKNQENTHLKNIRNTKSPLIGKHNTQDTRSRGISANNRALSPKQNLNKVSSKNTYDTLKKLNDIKNKPQEPAKMKTNPSKKLTRIKTDNTLPSVNTSRNNIGKHSDNTSRNNVSQNSKNMKKTIDVSLPGQSSTSKNKLKNINKTPSKLSSNKSKQAGAIPKKQSKGPLEPQESVVTFKNPNQSKVNSKVELPTVPSKLALSLDQIEAQNLETSIHPTNIVIESMQAEREKSEKSFGNTSDTNQIPSNLPVDTIPNNSAKSSTMKQDLQQTNQMPTQEVESPKPSQTINNNDKNSSIENENIDVLSCTVKLDTTLTDFEQKGGAEMFTKNLASAIGIEKGKIKVRDIREGSVIVDYDILIDQKMPSKDQISERQDQILREGIVDLGGPIVQKEPTMIVFANERGDHAEQSIELKEEEKSREQDWHEESQEIKDLEKEEQKSLERESERLPNENDFLPLRKLGRGSFGDVFLVKELATGKLFAMKTLSKRSGLEDSWLRYVKTERDVLAGSDCPFIVRLHYAFQTEKRLFLLIDFCPGGDLETMLSASREPFPEDKARFYIAEILLALKDLHSRDIIYRDLKPDNVVINDDGHAQLIDFGMAKSHIPDVQKGAKTFCGSVKYLAPEMVRKIGHGQALDWYLLGVLLYEMLVGVTPYFSTNKDELFDNIINGKLKLPRTISPEVKNLIICLLNRNPNKRLGSKPGSQGAEMIMSHEFFASIDWDELLNNKRCTNYEPEKPRYSMQDYLEVVTQTEFTRQQIDDIYNGDEDLSDNTAEGLTNQGDAYFVNVEGWEFSRYQNEQQQKFNTIQTVDELSEIDDSDKEGLDANYTYQQQSSIKQHQLKDFSHAQNREGKKYQRPTTARASRPEAVNTSKQHQNRVDSPKTNNKQTPGFKKEASNSAVQRSREHIRGKSSPDFSPAKQRLDQFNDSPQDGIDLRGEDFVANVKSQKK